MGSAEAPRALAGRSGGAPPQLLERERERAAIETALAATRDGEGRLLFIEAHAGIGKTALLADAAARAEPDGMTLLRARGSELEVNHPFGLALQIFEPALARIDQRKRDSLLSGAASLARPLLESRMAAQSEDDLFAVLHGLQWLTSNLAERRPLLITIDDAHWSDRLSLRFVLYLAQRIDELPVAMVLSARPTASGAPEELLRQIKAHESSEVLRPESLSTNGIGSFVRARMPAAEDEFVDACGEVTDGNPFLLGELLTDLANRAVEPTAANAGDVGALAPDSVLEAALVRLTRLPPAARPIARAVAILGEEAGLHRTVELAEVARDAIGPALDALVGGEILRPGEPLAFVHPLLRSAIRDEIPDSRRAAAHGRAARLLEGDGAAEDTVAGHLLLAPPSADAWTVEQLRRAGSRSMDQGAVEPAARFFGRALAEPPDADARAEVLLELGRAEALAGRAGSTKHLDRALESIDEPRRRAVILGELGWALQKRGLMAEAADAFDRGIRELDGEEHAALATELRCAYLGAAYLVPERAVGAREQIEAAIADPPRGVTTADLGLLALIATRHVFAGEARDEVVSICRRVLGEGALLDKENSDSPLVWHVVGCLSWSDEFDLAEEALETVFEDARRRGSVGAVAMAYYSRSWSLFWRGRLRDAAADAQAAIDAWSGEFSMYLPVAAQWLAFSLVELDDLDAAERAIALPDAEERWGQTALYGPLKWAEGRIARARGDHARALEAFISCGRSVLGAVVTNPAVVSWRSDAALAAAASGDSDQARQLAREELELARRFGAARGVGVALRAAALVAEDGSGVDLLRDAVAALRLSPSRLELARALIDLGGAVRRQGMPRDARDPLRAGLEMAQRFEAVALERKAHEELLAAGAKPRRRELRGVASLTPSELRVARMAAKGMTNRAIAEELFVTIKAVQFHLRNAYRKLEIKSREELAAALESES